MEAIPLLATSKPMPGPPPPPPAGVRSSRRSLASFAEVSYLYEVGNERSYAHTAHYPQSELQRTFQLSQVISRQ